jgi:alanine racemase
MTGRDAQRWAWAEIDLGALHHNVEQIRAAVAPATVWAVVKADGYGHGAVPIARQALAAGAAGLCVALTQEGVALRSAGIDAPILVLSEQPPGQLDQLVATTLIPTAYSTSYLDALVAAGARQLPVHIKFDTGMQRVGASLASATALVAHARALAPALRVDGVFTHLACADQPENPANAEQLDSFAVALTELARAGLAPACVHAANSAAALAIPSSRFDMVRAGIAIYGISPGAGVDHAASGLRPVLSLRARVAHVKPVAAGSHVSYGWRHQFDGDTVVATLPIGYADGVPRRLGTLDGAAGFDVLIGGRRCPIVGVVTMDQMTVDVGQLDGNAPVAVGDEAVLIGSQGEHAISAADWAERLGTIGYEVVCAITERVPRRYVGA